MAYSTRALYSAVGGTVGERGGGGCSPSAQRRGQLVAAADCHYHRGARELPVLLHPDVAKHGPVSVNRGLPLLCPFVLKQIGVLREADKVGCFILVGYVQPHFFWRRAGAC